MTKAPDIVPMAHLIGALWHSCLLHSYSRTFLIRFHFIIIVLIGRAFWIRHFLGFTRQIRPVPSGNCRYFFCATVETRFFSATFNGTPFSVAAKLHDIAAPCVVMEQSEIAEQKIIYGGRASDSVERNNTRCCN